MNNVLKLPEPFELNEKVATACLPSPNQTIPAGTPCYTAGWGKHLPSGGPRDSYNRKKLRETDLPVLSDEECRASGWGNENNGKIWDTRTPGVYGNKYDYWVDLDNQICAGHKDVNGVYNANQGVSKGDEG